jgi:hypothetical protein
MAGLREFVAQFGTEGQCIEHSLAHGFTCAGCGGRGAVKIITRQSIPSVNLLAIKAILTSPSLALKRTR